MSRAKTWALLAGMAAGLVAGPGCMMFDEFCDDDCECVGDRGYPLPVYGRGAIEHVSPGNDAQTHPAVPDR
jgi:hypothetical protein